MTNSDSQTTKTKKHNGHVPNSHDDIITLLIVTPAAVSTTFITTGLGPARQDTAPGRVDGWREQGTVGGVGAVDHHQPTTVDRHQRYGPELDTETETDTL